MTDIEQKRQKAQKINKFEAELQSNKLQHEEDGEDDPAQLHESQGDSDVLVHKESNPDIKKRLAFFGVVLIIWSAILIGFLYYYFFYNTEKQLYKYKDKLVEECPKATYLYNLVCFEGCPDKTVQRGGECVSACEEFDFYHNNKCIITNCSSSNNRRMLAEQMNSPALYDFTSSKCVSQCPPNSFNVFNEFCFDGGCPKDEIYMIVSQYNEKRDKKQIEEKSYDKVAKQFKNSTLDEYIITSNITDKVCSIGCTSQSLNYVSYNERIGRYECKQQCFDIQYVLKKNDQKICVDSCPPNLFVSALSNECVDSCGDLLSFKNLCVRTCNVGYLKEDKQCVEQCSPQYPLLYKKQECVKSCSFDPQFQYVQNGECVGFCSKYVNPTQIGLECVSSCEILGADGKTCQQSCGVDQVEVILNNQRQCIYLETCETPGHYFHPDLGCGNFCSGKYPIIFRGMCIAKCFDNWSHFMNECVEICPQSVRFRQEGNCITSCDAGYYAHEFDCFKDCPNDYFKHETTRRCTPSCDGVYTLPDRFCYQKCPPHKPYLHNNECIEMCPHQSYVYQGDDGTKNCFAECPDLTFKTPQRTCVKQCPQDLYIMKEMRQCVTNCPNSFDQDRVCRSRCQPEQRFIVGSEECFDICPSSFAKFEGTNECKKNCSAFLYIAPTGGENQCVANCGSIDKYQYSGKCVDTCPVFSNNNVCVEICPYNYPFTEEGKCVFKCSQGYVMHENKCLSKCPDHLYYIEGQTQCAQSCPQIYFIHEETKSCKYGCDNLIMGRHCVTKCPFVAIQIGNKCQLNNGNSPGLYFSKEGKMLDDCDQDNGYYTKERVCLQCGGGSNCKRCSHYFGLCIECKQDHYLFNDSCISSCPKGYAIKDGICIKDSEFLKRNLFFRQYTDSTILDPKAKVYFSILQDNDYIFNELNNNDNEIESDSTDNYIPTVVVQLHDLNSTYLDFYNYPFTKLNMTETQSYLDNLKLAVIDQGISILTVQCPEIIYFDSFFQFVINELLPSLGYFKANVVFSGIGVASNSIAKSVSKILFEQEGEMNRKIFGNLLYDMHQHFEEDPIVREFTLDQYFDFTKNFFFSSDQISSSINSVCQIYRPYLRLKDIVFMRTNNLSEITLNDFLAFQQYQGRCPGIQVRPQYMLSDFYKDKSLPLYSKQVIPKEEYLSENRKSTIYLFIAQNLLPEVASWIDNAAS